MKKEFERAVRRSLCYWVGWPAGSRRYQERGAGTKKAPRLARRLRKTKIGNGSGYLAFLGAFLSAFLAFFAMENLLPSFSRLFGQGKLANRDPARCNSYTSAGRKCQENFAS